MSSIYANCLCNPFFAKPVFIPISVAAQQPRVINDWIVIQTLSEVPIYLAAAEFERSDVVMDDLDEDNGE
jgi:hypothetical protein